MALFALVLLATQELAAQSVAARVDRNQATLEDQIQLQITVEGAEGATPQLPELPAFDIARGGVSNRMEFVNGRSTSSTIYSFILVPKEVGRFEFGPVRVQVGDGEISSRPFSLQIVAASESAQEDRSLFITAEVSDRTPFVGEQVIYTWRFYRRVRVGDARLDPIEFDGFTAEDLGETREYETTVQGVGYAVSEIRKALYPQETGVLTISASQLKCQVATRSRRRSRSLFDDFFGGTSTQTKVLRSRPIELEVQPLPAAPAGFGGLVGKFSIASSLSQSELKVGDSTTLAVTVRGAGNPQIISEPDLGEISWAKIYDDRPTSKIDRAGSQLSGSKTYRKALVPTRAGDWRVPAVTLTYFDPEAGSYQTVSSQAHQLNVLPGDGEEELGLTQLASPGAGKVAVKILADELLPLHKELASLRRRSLGWSTVTVLGMVLPPVCFLAIAVGAARHRRLSGDALLKRRLAAARVARKQLETIRSSSVGDAERLQEASRCLRTYLGDRFGVEGAALTPQEANSLLSDRGVGEELARRVGDFLNELEAVQYSGGSGASSKALEQVGEWVAELEREIKS